MVIYVLVSLLIAPSIQRLYKDDSTLIYAPSHFADARQYVYICAQGYSYPTNPTPMSSASRMSWMPVYALLQCGLHQFGVSLVYTGLVVSAVAIGLSLFLAVLVLRNLSVRRPALDALVVLIPLMSGIYLYLPGAEATFLAVGMAVLYWITIPAPSTALMAARSELLRIVSALPLGIVFALTKPNSLALVLPLLFAFVFLSWKRSQAAGYAFGFDVFVADVIIDHLRFTVELINKARRDPIQVERRIIRYDWTSLLIVSGVLLGFAGWLAYTSLFSGVPFYFLQQQLVVWGRPWTSGNLIEMIIYFSQAFQPPDTHKPWRYVAAWNLAAIIVSLIPAFTPRVPTLIRGMLILMSLFVLFSGAVYGIDRYNLSTALVVIGWGCWLGSSAPSRRRVGARWAFVVCFGLLTSYLLLNWMLPVGEPNSWGIVDYGQASR